MIFRNAYEFGKQQRLAWSCALIVILFLVLVGHAPVLPVVAGGALAVGVAVIRSWLLKKKASRRSE
jgi:predicted PurR-regulated permease PerM